ncbi:DUF2249 domain-containing protein [Halobiforma nitratireducens]|uniref:DUF2249 domain-containing protein n=1 Tax=Halobiforma nitratireducens JCM 10879 TaxID=1227454 RepID=M0M292_9EURY|nr:DUF2249 domain-containing protein [Halobiforma nitratireducens]EMA38724.1 hypothetical protein C446_09388 [Halobiforma nitratireducens JCM 10879]
MQSSASVVDRTDAPDERPREVIDVRSLGPPEPLKNTLEMLVELEDETVLVQRNDRVPQFLFPKLDDRGYDHETVELEDEVVTVIWVPAADADAGA